MAWRTTQEDVEGILGDNYDKTSDVSLTPFIETANTLVTEVVTCATARGVTLSTALRERIERWLSAHFYGSSDQFYAEKKTERASAVFQGQTGMYLAGTTYGSNAISLDVSGCLRAISEGAHASAVWLGRAPSDQTDYEDRD